MQREAIIRGPAVSVFDSVTTYSEGDIKPIIDIKTFDVMASAFGRVAQRVSGREARIGLKPAGKWSTALWPYGATAIGASIYGSTDRNLVLKPTNTANSMWTFYNCAITRMPSIFLGSTKTLVGDVEYTAIGKEATLPSVADSLFKLEVNTFNDTSFSPGDLVTQPYTANWGAVWTDIETVDGWQVDFNMQLKPITSDAYGVVDMILTGLEVTAKAKLLTPTEAQIVTALGVDKAMGADMGSGTDLVLSGTGVSFTLKNAVIKKAEPLFSLESARAGEIEFYAERKFTTGVAGPLFVVA